MTLSKKTNTNGFFREIAECLQDDADKIKYIAEFHLEYRDSTDRSAVIYSNGWNQLPVKVRLLLLDADQKPVKLSQGQLLKDNRLKFFLNDGTPVAMKPLSDKNSELTYWNIADDYATAVEYKQVVKPPAVNFIKPDTPDSLSEYDFVFIKVAAQTGSDINIKKLTVSYIYRNKETVIEATDYASNTVTWSKYHTLPAGNIVLKASVTDQLDNTAVATHNIVVPFPEQESSIIFNRPNNLPNPSSAHARPGDIVPVSVAFQTIEDDDINFIELFVDDEKVVSQGVDGTFFEKQHQFTMADSAYTTVKAKLGNQKQFSCFIYNRDESQNLNLPSDLSPAAHHAEDDNESFAIVYFSTAENSMDYEIYAQLDLPEVSDKTKDHEQLEIETLQSINYSDTTNWNVIAMPTSTKQYFETQRPWTGEDDTYFCDQEFRFEFTPSHPAFLSINNIGVLAPRLPLSDKTVFNYNNDVSALLPWQTLDGAFNINTWSVMNNGEYYGFMPGYDSPTSWETKDLDVELVSYFEVAGSYFVTDPATPPFTWISVHRSQLTYYKTYAATESYRWGAHNNDSVIEVRDLYGNYGKITVRYKPDNWEPIFPVTE